MSGLPPIELDEKTFLEDNFALPPLPEVIGRLLELLDSSEATARQVGELLTTDASLVAQVLRVVNSAYYGLPQRITDVKHAVAYLGLGEVKRIVTALAVMKGLEPPSVEDFKQFWEHSFYTSLTARVIARRFEPSLETEDLQIAALLHDVGKLVYMRFFPDHFAAMAAYAESEQRLLIDAEAEFGLPSHRTFGVLLCERWALPQPVQQACERHELDDLEGLVAGEAAGTTRTRVVCVANLLTNLATAQLRDDLRQRIQDGVKLALGCPDDQLLVLMGEVYDLKQDVADFLDQL